MLFRSIILCLFILVACHNQENERQKAANEKELPKIIQQLNLQIAQKPDSVALRLRLVDALDSLGKYDNALFQLDTLLRKDSTNFGLWYKQAHLKEFNGDTVGAIQSYSKAAKIYTTPDVLLALGNLYAEQKDNKALVAVANVSAMRLGRTYQSHCDFIAGVYFARTLQYPKAIAAFNQCIGNNYSYMEAYMEKGFIYYDQKQLKEAIQIFQTTITIKNNYADGYYWLGKSLEAAGNKQEAVDQYTRALALDANLKEASVGIARLKN
jgi:tetratricopeptide (TPR) repeat protein